MMHFTAHARMRIRDDGGESVRREPDTISGCTAKEAFRDLDPNEPNMKAVNPIRPKPDTVSGRRPVLREA